MERAFLGALALRPFIRSQMKEADQQYKLDNLTMETRVLWWSKLENKKHIQPFISGGYITVDKLRETEAMFRDTTRNSLLEIFRSKSYPVFSHIISPAYLTANTGLTTVMVKIPDMTPMHFNENEKCSAGRRLEQVPENLKLIKTRVMDSIPHPYA